jgi:hypothetical protein
MGKESIEWETQAHHVGIGSPENCCRPTGEVGEVEESGLRVDLKRSGHPEFRENMEQHHKVRRTAEYYAVECEECNQWIPIRPATRIDDLLVPQTFPEQFKIIDGHPHQNYIFHSAEVLIKELTHISLEHLAKIKVVKDPPETDTHSSDGS